jgi:2-keto-4-pentenoate hydratase/2-oxohepta-3-ene-1,7-dioic acid hydratase in catechol pathway
MALMIIRYDVGQGARWAVVTGAAPIHPDDLVEAQDLATEVTTLGDLVAELDAGRASPSGLVPVPARAILSPVTPDATLICQGLNYLDHAAEAGHHQRKANLLFAKASSSLCGPYADIVRPAGVELLDYEVEVGIVLRRSLGSGAVVDRSNIGSFVAGVVLCNDVSARDTMFGASFLQWYRGKSFRTFCPTGPVFYYLDQSDVAETIRQLDLALSREGEPRQAASSANFIYPPEEALTEIAGLQDLKRGDLLLTGTPGGIIARGTPEVIGILSAHLVDDVRRRDEIRVALGAPAFLQPGETLSLTLRDARRGLHLGGQLSTIVEDTAHVH